MSPNFLLVVTCVGLGLLLLVLGLPLLLERIGPNAWYGIRIAKAFRSDDNWYRINRYGGRQLLLWGSGLIGAGVAAALFPMDPVQAGVLAIALPTVACVGAVAATLFYAHRL